MASATDAPMHSLDACVDMNGVTGCAIERISVGIQTLLWPWIRDEDKCVWTILVSLSMTLQYHCIGPGRPSGSKPARAIVRSFGKMLMVIVIVYSRIAPFRSTEDRCNPHSTFQVMLYLLVEDGLVPSLVQCGCLKPCWFSSKLCTCFWGVIGIPGTMLHMVYDLYVSLMVRLLELLGVSEQVPPTGAVEARLQETAEASRRASLAMDDEMKRIVEKCKEEDRAVNVYMDLRKPWWRALAICLVQAGLLGFYMLEFSRPADSEDGDSDSPDAQFKNPQNFSMIKCIVATLATSISGAQDVGDPFKSGYWRQLYNDLRERGASHEQVLRSHIVTRGAMDFWINGVARSIIMGTLPIILSVEEPLDFIKDVMAVFFILKVDDLDGPANLKSVEAWDFADTDVEYTKHEFLDHASGLSIFRKLGVFPTKAEICKYIAEKHLDSEGVRRQSMFSLGKVEMEAEQQGTRIDRRRSSDALSDSQECNLGTPLLADKSRGGRLRTTAACAPEETASGANGKSRMDPVLPLAPPSSGAAGRGAAPEPAPSLQPLFGTPATPTERPGPPSPVGLRQQSAAQFESRMQDIAWRKAVVDKQLDDVLSGIRSLDLQSHELWQQADERSQCASQQRI